MGKKPKKMKKLRGRLGVKHHGRALSAVKANKQLLRKLRRDSKYN